MADQPTIEALVLYAGDLSEAAAKASAASATQHEIVHGDAVTDVLTESGLVPTHAKQARLYLEAIPDAVAELSTQMTDGRIYASEAVGRPLVADGQYFYAASSDPLISRTLWRRINSAASEHIADDSSATAVKAVSPKVLPMGSLKSPYIFALGEKVLAYFDKYGRWVSDHSHASLDSAVLNITALQSRVPRKLPLGPLGVKIGTAVGNKWVSAITDSGETIPAQPNGGTTSMTMVDDPNITAASLVAAQPVLMKDPAYTLTLVIHKIVVGQSNAFGRGSFVPDPTGAYDVMGTTSSPVKGDVFSKTDSIYGNFCLTMFSTDTTDYRVLKELVSTATDGSGNITGSGETLLSGWANMFQKWLRAGHYLPQRMIGTVHAIGGTKYPAMKKGTATYSQALTRVTNAKNIAITKGWNYEVQSISIVHGEAEGSDTTQAIYEGYLLEWWSDYNTDFKAITGQQRDIAAFLIGLSTFTAENQQIPLAQLAASEKYPPLIYVCPSYIFPYGDDVHRLAKGNFKHGEYEMRAERHWIAGRKWHPLKPKSVTKVDNVVTVQLNNTVYGTSETPGPVGGLVLDTANVSNPGNFGFRISNSTSTITAVALGDDKSSIVITLSSTPLEGAQIEYAMQYDLRNSGAPADPYIRFPTAGARGNVRDSDSRDISGFDSTPLFNWLVPFRQTIE